MSLIVSAHASIGGALRIRFAVPAPKGNRQALEALRTAIDNALLLGADAKRDVS